ncbi:hypothetical protein [Thermococcus thermotolerans]|uniref:hypothetical protein n=1 Tax=Thermococcus thermotolerans TaxID=2969672 RepID=UPI0021575C54|nr:hypothetical protein [Thermococcus thermotolerans]
MDIVERFRRVLHIWKSSKKPVKYARVRCDLLSECIKRTERLLNSKGIRYNRLVDPDPYLLTAVAEPFYEKGEFLGVLELKDGLSRAFYLLESNVPINLKDVPGLEFDIAFMIRKKEGLAALLRVIHEGKVGGARHKHRSTLNFLTSFFGSLFLSSVMDFESYWVQFIIMLILTVVLFMILDYPFSLLYFKGVEVVSTAEQPTKIFVIKVRMEEEKRS